MLKDFEIIYIDAGGYEHREMVMAFDAEQAIHAYIYNHPDVDTMGLSCRPL